MTDSSTLELEAGATPLEQTVDELEAAHALVDRLAARRDELIRAELELERPVSQLARVTGLTRARIHQIRAAQ